MKVYTETATEKAIDLMEFENENAARTGEKEREKITETAFDCFSRRRF